MGQGNTESTQFFRVHFHLVLLNHAAERRDFGNTRHGLQLVFQEPVLQAAQLTEVMLAGTVHQGVEIDPANSGSVRPQLRPSTRR